LTKGQRGFPIVAGSLSRKLRVDGDVEGLPDNGGDVWTAGENIAVVEGWSNFWRVVCVSESDPIWWDVAGYSYGVDLTFGRTEEARRFGFGCVFY